MTPETSRAVAPVRPWVRRLALRLAPILLIAGLWQAWDAVEARRLARAIAALEDGLEASGTAPRDGLDDADRYYDAADAFVRSSPYRLSSQALGEARAALVAGGDLPAGLLTSLEAAVRMDAPAIDLLERGASLPVTGRPVIGNGYTSVPLSLNLRASAATLARVAIGDADGAVRLLLARLSHLRIFDTFDPDAPYMARAANPGWKAGFVVDIIDDADILLTSAAPSDARLDELQAALSLVHAPGELEQGLRRDALYVNSILTARSIMSGPFLPLRPALRHNALVLAEQALDAVAVAQRPWPERVRDMADLPAPGWSLPLPRRFRSVAPEIRARVHIEAAERVATALARVRSLRLAILAERYRRATGALPGALSDLDVAGDEMLDPYTGQPLRYATDAAGYTVYSVGPNGEDDGGALTREPRPVGLAPGARNPGPDVGVRIGPPA
jgi:hypothetical protein